jgi:hypothetical protein
MMHRGYKTTWRWLVAALLVLVTVGGLFTAQSAAAAPTGEGIDLGNMGNTAEPAEGISPDGTLVCAVWGTYDQGDSNAVYVRLYNTATGAVSPANAYQLASASDIGKAHCAIDAKGNVHTVWQQKGNDGQQISYRMLPAGSDPSNGWTSPYTIQTNRDGPDIDALYADTNGQVWLAYRLYQGQFEVRNWANGSWSGPQSVSADAGADKVRIGVDNAGYVNLTWRDGNNGVGYAYRNPSTGQFSGKYVIPGSNGAGLSSIAVDKNSGDVNITYPKNFTELHYVKGGRGGTNFSDRIVATGTNAILQPRIAWSANGRLIIAYDNGAADKQKVSITAITSENNGANWGNPAVIASPGGGAQAPWVVADANGGAYILYAHTNGARVYLTTIPGTAAPCTTTFCDVPSTYWAHDQIESFAQRGITTGCDTKLYCPERNVTRAEMAVFIERTFGDTAPPTPAAQTFTDVPPTYWAYAFIDQFYKRGVTTGCGVGEYCPDRNVTRAEMAAFIERALGNPSPTPPATPSFADVPPTHPQFAYIEALYKARITTGCGSDANGKLLYCPDRNVTRAEMAVFITRAFPAAR